MKNANRLTLLMKFLLKLLKKINDFKITIKKYYVNKTFGFFNADFFIYVTIISEKVKISKKKIYFFEFHATSRKRKKANKIFFFQFRLR